jgi:sugar phosphate isomerase/epimerase
VHADDPAGAVDFPAVLARLEQLDYRGKLSVEYFDLPENGWPLEDPEQWARDLAARIRAL